MIGSLVCRGEPDHGAQRVAPAAVSHQGQRYNCVQYAFDVWVSPAGPPPIAARRFPVMRASTGPSGPESAGIQLLMPESNVPAPLAGSVHQIMSENGAARCV